MKIKVTLDTPIAEKVVGKKPKNKNTKDIRINKYLSDAGFFSRREADKLIEKGLIHINDRVAILGDRVKTGDSVFVNKKDEDKKYFIYNKPRGEETKYKNMNGVRYDPMGRLDKESEGLLIYTNDFRIVEGLLNPKNNLEREYIVTTKEKATPRVKTILERGIETQEGTYAPVKRVILNDENRYITHIILTEGKKHEIRRMLNALNLTIKSLRRVRFEFLKLGSMKAGEFKELAKVDSEKLLKLLKIEKEQDKDETK